jgi:small subunit ribosomal protein S16
MNRNIFSKEEEMALAIRLRRMGKANMAFYRLVVADSRRSAKCGPYIEELGYYNPVINPAIVKVDVDKVKSWIAKGAQPSDTAKDLLMKLGAYEPKKTKAKKKKVKKEKAK